jgi:RNA polymerase sigma-70 factor (ECF subfamily)
MAPRSSTPLDVGLARDLTLPHLDSAYNLARWLMGSPQDASDAVHTAFLRAARYVHTYAGGNARAWWLSIVRNCCLATLAARRPRDVSIDQLSTDSAANLAATGANEPEERLHLAQSAALVMKHLENLPREFREALVLREIEDASYREIGEILGVPIGTVMSRLARARRMLRQALSMETGAQP